LRNLHFSTPDSGVGRAERKWMEGVVIVGAGHTGAQAAKTLRQEGWRGAITLVGAETEPPYQRPPLSKEILTGAKTLSDYCLFETSFLERHEIELRAGTRAVAIDRKGQEISLENGSRLRYGRLLLATGAEPRRLTVPEVGPGNIHYLRSAADARGLAYVIRGGRRLIIVGGGFIGLEVAASAASRGCQVSVIEAGARLVMRSVPAEIEKLLAARHRVAGVTFHLNRQVAGIRWTRDRVEVDLDDGTRLHGDAILAAIGVAPRVELAEAAGLAVDNGIAVDATLRTSDPNIFAAGDASSFPHSLFGSRIRLECWKNAEDQGVTAARNILGAGEEYGGAPWLWSDQYELSIQVAGLLALAVSHVARPVEGGLLVFHLGSDGRLVCASGIGSEAAIGRDIRVAQLMIERGLRPRVEALADITVRLKSLLVAKAA
jgi:3-phenylpropionate/trans-cinnamate dioxygenase ferredoxin reductase component